MDFYEELSSAAPIQRYKLKVLDEDRKADSILIYISGREGESFKGEFYVKGSSVNRKFESYNGRDYFVRIYPSEELTDDIYIESNVDDRVVAGIKSNAFPKVVPLEDITLMLNGDHLSPNKTNCYSSIRFTKGANLMLETDMTDIQLYINPLNLPNQTKDFAYSYTRGEFTVLPADISTSSITVSVPATEIAYICIETKKPLAYTLSVVDPDPLLLRRGQNIKLYLKGTMKAIYSEIKRTQSPMRLAIESLKGCTEVMIKVRKSYYYNYLMNINESLGINPFDSPKDEDTAIIKLRTKGESIVHAIDYPSVNTRCTGEDVYTDCPTLFYARSCNNEDSIVFIGLEDNDDFTYVLGVPEFIVLPPFFKKTYLVPDISPAIDTLQIFVEVKKEMRTIVRGLMTVENGKGIKDVREISGASKNIVLNFSRTRTEMAGNLYITVESYEELSIKLKVKMYSIINGVEEEVKNIRGGSAGQMMILEIVNSTYQVGYFTFYGKNDSGNVAAIIPNHTPILKSVKMYASTEGWPTPQNAAFTGSILRLPREDKFYNIFIEGIPSEEYGNNGEIEGFLVPGILESQRYNELRVGANSSFDGQRIFKFYAERNTDYIIKKVGVTVESIFVSVDPKIQIPLKDSFTHMIGPIDPEETDLPVEYTLKIPKEDLTKTNEVTFTVFCHWMRCRYHLWVGKSDNIKSDL